jgi:NADPH:quinone reductase-like Zn-dependent oxidoreductase
MKAVRIHNYGGPEALVYEDAPIPALESGEVLIRVHAAGVNPLDWKVREGYGKEWFHHRLPLIPGWDVAGIVDALSEGVTNIKIGESVYGFLDTRRDGAYAEFTAARALHVVPKPKTLDHIHAAAVPIAALAAWQSLFDLAGLSGGQGVLIHAAAGGVGHFAVQMAKWKGARVIGTASSRKADFLRELGADEIIDYKAKRFEDAIHDVDVVLDTLGGEIQQRSWKVLKKGGILVSTLGITSRPDSDMRAKSLSVNPSAGQLAEIAELIDAKHIKPIVETVLSLAEARRAHELSQSGRSQGKIVLRVI